MRPIGASNLSELEVTLGRLTDAVADARRSITYADQSGDAFQRMVKSHHGGGCLAAVRPACRSRHALRRSGTDAERRQAAVSPCSIRCNGFRYCDWLLAPVERFAWRALLRGSDFPIERDEYGEDDPATICDEVERRAATTLAWVTPQTPLLDIALDHLTLARVGLVRAILAHPLPQPTLDLPHVAAAVNGFRDAGTIHHLPKGLLTAALVSLRPGRYRGGPHGPRPGPGDRRARPDAARPRRRPPPPRPPLPRPGRARQGPRPHHEAWLRATRRGVGRRRSRRRGLARMRLPVADAPSRTPPEGRGSVRARVLGRAGTSYPGSDGASPPGDRGSPQSEGRVSTAQGPKGEEPSGLPRRDLPRPSSRLRD